MKNCSVISMSKVYESEDFYRPFLNMKYVDCTDITGVNCYVDADAVGVLRERMVNVHLEGVHFIDSGNFHYLTYLFLERIEYDFALVLIDKHPDCKKPMFEEMLSCGGWVRNAFMSLMHLKHVYMIGTDESLLEELDDLGQYKNKAFVVKDMSDIDKESLPIYISIDKDALSSSVLTTNWDQGVMTIEELDECLDMIISGHEIIGTDICGEPDIFDAPSALSKSDSVNSHLLSFLYGKCVFDNIQ